MEDEQCHPLRYVDKNIIDNLIVKKVPDDFDMVNLSRLLNRYNNFPGEPEIQNDLRKVLSFWEISKQDLFLKTQEIWAKGFRPPNSTKDLIGSGFDTSNEDIKS